MERAVAGLGLEPAHVLVDGNRLPRWSWPSTAVVGGDDRVEAIAAASILAKVTRDRELLELDRRYPHHGFAAHKRSEEHTSELQSRGHLVCRLLLENKMSTSTRCGN